MCQKNECVICLDTINPDDEYQSKCCNHYFHKSCIQKWIDTQESKFKSCPYCREELNCISHFPINNCNLSQIQKKFNFNIQIKLNGEDFLISDINMFSSGIIQHKYNYEGVKMTVPINLYYARVTNIKKNLYTDYYITLTVIYMYIKNKRNVCVNKELISDAYIDSNIDDNHDFYKNIYKHNINYREYSVQQKILEILN